MRAHLVVVGLPAYDLDAGQLHALKPMLFQALVAELPVEALDMGVLRGLAWLVEDVSHALGLRLGDLPLPPYQLGALCPDLNSRKAVVDQLPQPA